MAADDGFDCGGVQSVQDGEETFAGDYVGAFDSVSNERVDDDVPS